MGGFSNFAISFTIISILAGCLTSYFIAFNNGGPVAITWGWLPGSFAPTAVAWGLDNRTCALRVVGHGKSLRVENRLPGADVNPYLAVAASIAAGLDGIDRQLPLEPPFAGNAYDSDRPQIPQCCARGVGCVRRGGDGLGEVSWFRTALGLGLIDR